MPLPEIASALDFQITTQPTNTYAIDFENKRIVGMTDGLSAMVQAIRKILTTSRYAERIYSGDYGAEVASLIGKPLSYIRAVMRMFLDEAFSVDSRIRGIRKLEIAQRECDELTVTVSVLTEYGEVYVEHELRG